MALLGNPFSKYVVKQVEKRQEALGQGLGGYPVNDLIPINTKKAFLTSTPYIHLVSAIKIEKDTEESNKLPGNSIYKSIKDTGLLTGFTDNQWLGNNLTRTFMLTGAPNSVSGKRSPSGVIGINSGNEIPGASGGATNSPYPEALIKAYGWGYNATGVNSGQGYVPPPGVTSVDFEYKNDGALAIATVNIKAFSKEQFAMIDILYMRPGYTCLLEFGHSVYLNNEGGIVQASQFQSRPMRYIFNDFEKNALPKSATSMAQLISKEKSDKEGNYEGFFGRVTKFNWKFNMDGSYDITVKLTGLGDVISSLNTLQPMGNAQKPFSIKSDFVMKAEAKDSDVGAEVRKQREKEEKIKKENKAKSEDVPWYENLKDNIISLNNQYQELKQDVAFAITDAVIDTSTAVVAAVEGDTLSDSEKETAKEEGSFIIADAHKSQLNYDLYAIFADKTLFKDSSYGVNDESKRYDLPLTQVPVGIGKENITIKGGVVKIDVSEWVSDPEFSPATWVKFGGFLCMLQKICQITDHKQSNLIQFEIVKNLTDTIKSGGSKNFDDTYLVTYPGNYSSDPNKCLIKYIDFNANSFPTGTENIPSIPVNTVANEILHKTADVPANTDTPLLLYRLSDVYLNLNFITTILSNSTTSGADGVQEVPILTLIDDILSGINESLGGINEFRVIYNEETAEIKILSESPVSTIKEPSPDPIATINTFGFESGTINNGSFITSLDLNSELSDQMATQITIGAQANGNTSNGSATSFSSFSKGLIDNLMPVKSNPMDEDKPDKPIEETVAEKISKIYDETDILDAFSEVYDNRNFDESDYVGVLTSNNNTISQMMVGLLHQRNESPAPFFLPFNMSLEMHGLGGVRIYDAFKIDGKGLPLSYNPSEIKLMVKSLSHTISLDGWKTKISTIPLPIANPKPSKYKEVGTATSTATSSGRTSNNNTPGSALPLSNVEAPASLNPTSKKRFEAMKSAYNQVFRRDGEVGGMCAQWTYNLARAYTLNLKNQPANIGKKLAAGGNANWNKQYHTNLIKLGYSQTKSIVTKSQLISKLVTTTWGYGDVVVYWSNDGPKSQSHVMYGHTQIYVGEINKPKWASSKRLNYNTYFPYGKRIGDNWTYIVFRAPST